MTSNTGDVLDRRLARHFCQRCESRAREKRSLRCSIWSVARKCRAALMIVDVDVVVLACTTKHGCDTHLAIWSLRVDSDSGNMLCDGSVVD